MRAQLRAQIDQGKSHDDIVQALIGVYGGQQFLQAPVDKGFNRIAWLLPYLVAGTGLVAIGFAAIRWSRHPEAESAPAAPRDPDLDDRINHDIRDLDSRR